MRQNLRRKRPGNETVKNTVKSLFTSGKEDTGEWATYPTVHEAPCVGKGCFDPGYIHFGMLLIPVFKKNQAAKKLKSART